MSQATLPRMGCHDRALSVLAVVRCWRVVPCRTKPQPRSGSWPLGDALHYVSAFTSTIFLDAAFVGAAPCVALGASSP